MAWTAETRKLHMREWRRKNPELARARDRASWRRHREVRLLDAQEWREGHKKEVAEYKARWRAENRDRCRSYQATRRARRRAARIGACPQVRALYFIARWLRERGDDVHVDHRIPLSKGGSHTIDNLQILPAAENRRKSNKLP